MLEDIRCNDVGHGNAIAAAAGTIYNPIGDNCIARVTPKGYLLGGVVYQRYTGMGGSIAMHVASFRPKWLSRELLWVAFDYPFNQLNVRKVFIQVRSENLASMRFVRHLGFADEAIIKDAYPDGDIRLLAMYRDDCRFLTSRLLKGRLHG